MSKNKIDTDGIKVQKIELKAEERIWKIQKIKKKEILFWKKKSKYIFNFNRKKCLKIKLNEVRLEFEKRIQEIQEIKLEEIRGKEESKIKAYAKAFDDYIIIKSEFFRDDTKFNRKRREDKKQRNYIEELKKKKEKAKVKFRKSKPFYCFETSSRKGKNFFETIKEEKAKLWEIWDEIPALRNCLNKDKKTLEKILNVFKDLFTETVSKNKKSKKKDNFPAIIFCPYCGTKIDTARLNNLPEEIKK